MASVAVPLPRLSLPLGGNPVAGLHESIGGSGSEDYYSFLSGVTTEHEPPLWRSRT